MRSTLAILWSEGLLNTVNGQPRREAVFWFLATGLLLLILGGLVDHLEKSNLPIPNFLPWSCAVLTGIGIVVMPISGIWLFSPPVIGMFFRANSLRKTGSA